MEIYSVAIALIFTESQMCPTTRSTCELKKEKNPIFTLELSQKSDFQPSTTKLDNIGHSIIKTRQIWTLEWF
jgi:hypothetical protein